MEYKEPTYEEYKKATDFGRFRYRFGLLIQILAWLSLLFIIFYMVSNGEAIARHPLIYGADKYNVTCTCITPQGYTVYVNSSSLWSDESNWFGEELNFSNITIRELK